MNRSLNIGSIINRKCQNHCINIGYKNQYKPNSISFNKSNNNIYFRSYLTQSHLNLYHFDTQIKFKVDYPEGSTKAHYYMEAMNPSPPERNLLMAQSEFFFKLFSYEKAIRFAEKALTIPDEKDRDLDVINNEKMCAHLYIIESMFKLNGDLKVINNLCDTVFKDYRKYLSLSDLTMLFNLYIAEKESLPKVKPVFEEMLNYCRIKNDPNIFIMPSELMRYASHSILVLRDLDEGFKLMANAFDSINRNQNRKEVLEKVLETNEIFTTFWPHFPKELKLLDGFEKHLLTILKPVDVYFIFTFMMGSINQLSVAFEYCQKALEIVDKKDIRFYLLAHYQLSLMNKELFESKSQQNFIGQISSILKENNSQKVSYKKYELKILLETLKFYQSTIPFNQNDWAQFIGKLSEQDKAFVNRMSIHLSSTIDEIQKYTKNWFRILDSSPLESGKSNHLDHLKKIFKVAADIVEMYDLKNRENIEGFLRTLMDFHIGNYNSISKKIVRNEIKKLDGFKFSPIDDIKWNLTPFPTTKEEILKCLSESHFYNYDNEDTALHHSFKEMAGEKPYGYYSTGLIFQIHRYHKFPMPLSELFSECLSNKYPFENNLDRLLFYTTKGFTEGLHLGQLEESLNTLNTLIKENPKFYPARLVLARVLSHHMRVNESESLLNQLVSELSDGSNNLTLAHVLTHLGFIHTMKGNFQQSLDIFNSIYSKKILDENSTHRINYDIKRGILECRLYQISQEVDEFLEKGNLDAQIVNILHVIGSITHKILSNRNSFSYHIKFKNQDTKTLSLQDPKLQNDLNTIMSCYGKIYPDLEFVTPVEINSDHMINAMSNFLMYIKK